MTRNILTKANTGRWITLPSGFDVQISTSTMTILFRGSQTNPYINIAQQILGLKEDMDKGSEIDTVEVAAFLDAATCEGVCQPRIYMSREEAEAAGAEAIFVGDLNDEDKAYIFKQISGARPELATFPAKQGSVEPDSDVPPLQPASIALDQVP